MEQRRIYIREKLTIVLLMAAALLLSVFFIRIDAQAASKPADVKVKVKSYTNSKVALTWNNVANEDGYIVYRRILGEPHYKAIKSVKANVTSYKDKKADSATIYQYAVCAYCKSNSGKIKSDYVPAEVCTKPNNIKPSAVNASGNVKLSWKKVPRAYGYCIYRKKAGGKWTGVKGGPSNFVSYTDTTASQGEKYYYCVRAYRLFNGNRVYSDRVASSAVTPLDKTLVLSGAFAKTGTMTTAQKKVMKKILYAVESGGQVYGNQDYKCFVGVGGNVASEVAITIGAGQWYAGEAKLLLQKIYDADPKAFKKIDKDGLIQKDLKKSWERYGVTKTSKKGKLILQLISSKVGIKCQDELMLEQITNLAHIARTKYGVENISGQMEAINIIHQGGEGALSRILKKTQKPYSVETIYRALCTDTQDGFNNQVGDYTSRQKCVYNWIKEYLK